MTDGQWDECPAGLMTKMAGELRAKQLRMRLRPVLAGVAMLLVLGLGWAAQSRINTAAKPLNCAETRSLLADYHNGALGAATTTRVAKHLANCHSCRKHSENQFPGEARVNGDSPSPLAKHGPTRLLATR